MKALKLLALSWFCIGIGSIYAEGIDRIQTHAEGNRIKVFVEWSLSGCYHPTDSIIVDNTLGEARIYRTETVPECDMITHNKDSFHVEQGAFNELDIQLYKRSWKGGTEAEPVYGDYFLADSKTLRLSEAVYFPTGTVWTEVTTNLLDETYCMINTYEVAGDTTINETVYRKVLLNGNALYALREQDDKVYLMSLQFPEQEQERLAYDFAWEVGKTLYFQYMDAASDEYVPMCTIQEIDQVQLADGQLYDYAEGYIRGIGGKSGIFQHMMAHPDNGDQIHLLCFSRNRTLIYQNKEYAGCESCERAEYTPLVDESLTWSYCDVVKRDMDQYDMTYTRYYFKGDTTINGTTYKKLYQEDCDGAIDCVAAMREDGMKVYMADNELTDVGEKLIYDFGLTIGDAMGGDVLLATSLVQTEDGERIKFDFGFDTWIEGIGSLERQLHLPLSPVLLYELGVRLNWQKRDGVIVYKTDGFWFKENECETSLSPILPAAQGIRITQPAQGVLCIATDAEEAFDVDIYDLSGQRLLSCQGTNGQRLDVSVLPAGVYLLSIDGMGMRKFVKQ